MKLDGSLCVADVLPPAEAGAVVLHPDKVSRAVPGLPNRSTSDATLLRIPDFDPGR